MIFVYTQPSSLFAARIYAEGVNKVIKQGEEFKVDIFLDTEGLEINALQGEILLSKDLLTVQDIQNGNSAITFLIDTPSVLDLNNNGSTSFSGIIPGGYRNDKGYLFSLILKPKVDGRATLLLENIRVVENDENTSVENVKAKGYTITLSKEIGTSTVEIIEDRVAPELFKPIIAQDAEILDGKYFILFVTQDKGSGIDYFEVREGRWGTYVRSESPYILENQKASDVVYVKAVDKQGNERVVSIVGPAYRPWYKNPWIISLSILAVLLLGFRKRKS